jgi:hypothetical protein
LLTRLLVVRQDVPSGSSPAKPSRAPKKKVKIDLDEDEDKPVVSTSSSAAKGKVRS